MLRLPFERVWGSHSIDPHDPVLSLYECMACGLEWFSPLRLGEGHFYAELERDGAYYEGTRWEFGFMATRLKPSDTVLDLGCGDGAFLRRIRTTVSHAVGFDFNPDALDRLASEGFETLSGDLATVARDNEGRFDVVTAFHVLEHLDDVRTFVTTAAPMLKSGGTFIASMPNRDRLRLDDVEPLDFPPHHASRWSTTQLGRLADETDLTLLETRHEPTKLKTQVHVLGARALRAMRREPGEAGAPSLGHQLEHRHEGLAILGVFRKR
ncbi:MAG TPA: class I SAM-dependent methyltransferase [Acidimicrobiales bacterium]|nr:class I SAM-dependent methyltransferase [Acidimicrobiales bacterium]